MNAFSYQGSGLKIVGVSPNRRDDVPHTGTTVPAGTDNLRVCIGWGKFSKPYWRGVNDHRIDMRGYRGSNRAHGYEKPD
jgi:hypothetical protein